MLDAVQTPQGATATQEAFFGGFFVFGDGQVAQVSVLSADSGKSRLAGRSAASEAWSLTARGCGENGAV